MCIDRTPEFLYVPSHQVAQTTAASGAIAYDIPGVEYSHVGELCSFDGLSLGLSQVFHDDHEMLKHGMVMYDAIYAGCKSYQSETDNWPPKM